MRFIRVTVQVEDDESDEYYFPCVNGLYIGDKVTEMAEEFAPSDVYTITLEMFDTFELTMVAMCGLLNDDDDDDDELTVARSETFQCAREDLIHLRVWNNILD
jgi:hypothetical protein